MDPARGLPKEFPVQLGDPAQLRNAKLWIMQNLTRDSQGFFPYNHIDHTFYFSHHKDAVAFALKWA